jgi:membrane protein DedA with SNARE-associated domain
MENALQAKILEFINNCGNLGVFIGMFLESSIVPIPSEVIIMGAAAAGISIASVTIFGSLGATLGAIIGYLIGRYGAKPLIIRYGKFILIKPYHIEKAESFAKKYGSFSVFIGRILPIVPFKVFSIAAGIIKIPLLQFIIYTALGVIPRTFILSLFGLSLIKYTNITLLILGFGILVWAAYQIIRNKKN